MIIDKKCEKKTIVIKDIPRNYEVVITYETVKYLMQEKKKIKIIKCNTF